MLQRAIDSVQGKSYSIPNDPKKFDEELQTIESDHHRNIKILEESEKKIDEELLQFYSVSSTNGVSLIEEY